MSLWLVGVSLGNQVTAQINRVIQVENPIAGVSATGSEASHGGFDGRVGTDDDILLTFDAEGKRTDLRFRGREPLDELLVRQSRRRRRTGNGNSVFCTQRTGRTVTEAQHAAEPGADIRIGIDQRRGHWGAFEEPQTMGQGEVSNRWLTKQEVARLARQPHHALDVPTRVECEQPDVLREVEQVEAGVDELVAGGEPRLGEGEAIPLLGEQHEDLPSAHRAVPQPM